MEFRCKLLIQWLGTSFRHKTGGGAWEVMESSPFQPRSGSWEQPAANHSQVPSVWHRWYYFNINIFLTARFTNGERGWPIHHMLSWWCQYMFCYNALLYGRCRIQYSSFFFFLFLQPFGSKWRLLALGIASGIQKPASFFSNIADVVL